MDEAFTAAAMWGGAQNLAYSIEDRLNMALKALEFYGKHYEEHEE